MLKFGGPTWLHGDRDALFVSGKARHGGRDALFVSRKARHGGRDALFVSGKARHDGRDALNTEAVERFSLVKTCSVGFYNMLLVISIHDEYGEEGDDDYETKDMGVHDMDAINELISSTIFVKHAAYGRRNRRRKRTLKDTEGETEKGKRTAEGTAD